MGPDRIGEYVDTVIDLTVDVAARIETEPAIELAAAPHLSTLVFRYRPEDRTEEEADWLAPRIRSTLYDRGTAMVAGTKVDGRSWLKLTLLNPLTTTEDVLGILAEAVAVGDELAAAREAAA